MEKIYQRNRFYSFNFIVGSIIGPKDDLSLAQGFVGVTGEAFKQNWGSNYKYSEGVNQNFFSVFAIFFPSVTGLQAGANISGDLKVLLERLNRFTMLVTMCRFH